MRRRAEGQGSCREAPQGAKVKKKKPNKKLDTKLEK